MTTIAAPPVRCVRLPHRALLFLSKRQVSFHVDNVYILTLLVDYLFLAARSSEQCFL